MKKIALFLLVVGLAILMSVSASAQRKLRYGGAVRTFPPHLLPALAAQEKGFWKQNGLEAEVTLFGFGAAMTQAMAAGHIDIGGITSVAAMQAMAVGAPLVIISDLVTQGAGFDLYVIAESPIKEAKDLKGKRFGVNLRTASHAYGQMVAKSLGIDVKFIGAGGVETAVALLKAGQVDAIIFSFGPMASLILAKEVRKLLSIEDYLPKEWVEQVIVAHKNIFRSEPDTVKRALKSLIQGANFLKENRAWTVEKMKKEFRYKEEAANIAFERFIKTINLGSLNGKGVENVRDFLLEYEILSKEKVPPAKAMYDTQVVEALAGDGGK